MSITEKDFTEFNAVEPVVTAVDTPEKFLPMMDELVPFLVGYLRKLCHIEEETLLKSDEIDRQKEAAGIPEWQDVPESEELFNTHKKQYGEIAKQFCTEKLLARGYGNSYGDPAEYAYLNTGCELFFTMKSAKRAVVESHYESGIEKKHKFVLTSTEDGWKLDSVSYSYGKQDGWHNYYI